MANKKKKTTSSADVKTKNSKGKKKSKFMANHPKLKKAIKIFFIILVILIIVGIGILAGAFFGLFGDDFKIDKEDLTIENINATVLDKEGNIIAELSKDEKRKVINLSDMPGYLSKAFVSIEDERFYSHHGVDLKRTAAATVTYVFHRGSSSFGGSTITQQLVKNLTQDKEKSGVAGILRKVKEMSKAYQVEQMLSKDQILELYLNLIGLGGQAYGVEMASQLYFSKSAKDLDLAECAYLAGINNSPSLYKPFNDNESDKEKIKKRTQTVLTKMKDLGAIKSDEEYNAAMKEVEDGLAFKKGDLSTGASYSYHTAAALKQVKQDLMSKNGWSEELAEMQLYTKGYKIYTTQDTTIQDRMEQEFKESKYIVKSKITKNEDTGEYAHSQAAMVIIDHTTGQVVGTVGGLGNDVDAYGQNRATQSKRQTGSSMKPIAVIGPALEEGIITAGTVYDDCETSFDNGKYNPKNYYSGYKGLSTVRYAIEISQNIVPLKIMTELTPKKSIEYARKMGITSLVTTSENKVHNDETLSLALGGVTIGVSPLELAGAYATIANGGEYITPTFYTKVEDGKGKTVIESKQEKTRVMSEQNAYIEKSILTQPVVGSNGTAKYCSISGMDVAAKTGTTNDDYDRWLCQFTPYYTAATWYGYDINETVKYSGNPAGKISSAVMGDIHKGLEKKKFEQPNGIETATICKNTGLLATDSCSNKITEMFVKGTAPTQTCQEGEKVNICTETNLVANEYCSQYCEVQEKTYAKMPPKEEYGNNKLWSSNYGNKYTAPTDVCTVHIKKEEQQPVAPATPQIESVNIPNVVGMKVANAKENLTKLKLNVEVKYTEEKGKEDGLVLKQSLNAGTTADVNSKIILTVNKLTSTANTTNGNTVDSNQTVNTTNTPVETVTNTNQ